MVHDRGLERVEGSIVKEGRRHLQIAERCGAEHVTQSRIALRLLEAEVFVLARAVEDHVARPDAEQRRKLWAADSVRLEVAEHLVRVAGHGVAADAACLTEKEQRAALLTRRHRVPLTAGEAIQRRIRGGEHSLKFCDRSPPHADRDAVRERGRRR